MRKTFQHANFQALAKLWNEMYPEKYRIDAALLELNTVQSPVFDWGVSQIEVDASGEVMAFVAFKRSAAGLFKGPSIDQAHMSAIAYRDPMLAVDLVAEAKRTLRNRGVNKVVFGADSRHFWPGCPADVGSLCGFLMVEGFEDIGEAFDLERDLAGYELPSPAPMGFDFRPLASDDDVVALRVFLESEFPGRWLHDTMDKIRAENDPSCVFVALEGNKVVGFALIQSANHQLPIGGAVWRDSLGEHWGSLGPIGVSADMRGQGLGHGVLGAALMHLKSLGVRQCIIDWTTLDQFYGRHGFEVTRTYKPCSLRLGE